MQVRSASSPSTWYDISIENGTCSCPSFEKDKHCKHLDMVGVYKQKEWVPPTHPSFSQALSGLVKALRVRDVNEAVYWSWYLYRSTDNGARFRFARRLLIGSSEDGHSVAVMKRTSSNFGLLCRQVTPFQHYVAECKRICDVPNWWHEKTNGPTYIQQGMVSKRKYLFGGIEEEFLLPMQEEALWGRINDMVDDKNTVDALAYTWLAMETKGADQTAIAKRILAMAEKRNDQVAIDLASVHLAHYTPLKGDGNFLGQAVWTMSEGASPVANEIHKVMTTDTDALIATAMERWKSPKPIKAWMCDGVHCTGSDRRFCGMWQDMWGVCRAYEVYGDKFVELQGNREFFSLEGLPLRDSENA